MLQLNQDVEEAELTVHFVQGNQVEKKSFFLSCLVTFSLQAMQYQFQTNV